MDYVLETARLLKKFIEQETNRQHIILVDYRLKKGKIKVKYYYKVKSSNNEQLEIKGTHKISLIHYITFLYSTLKSNSNM